MPARALSNNGKHGWGERRNPSDREFQFQEQEAHETDTAMDAGESTSEKGV